MSAAVYRFRKQSKTIDSTDQQIELKLERAAILILVIWGLNRQIIYKTDKI